MTQDTKSKLAAILAAQQAKTAGKITPKFATNPKPVKQPAAPVPTPKPQPAPQAKQSQMPELSTTTYADLFADKNGQFCTPVTFTAPTPAKVQPEQPKEESPVLQIIDYSEKSFAVVSKERPSEEIREILRTCGGTYNPFLKCGKGWIFSKKRLQQVKTALKIAV